MAKTIIPFGPQHPVLPEPLHLKLTVEDEVITDVIPAQGFVHRGLEMLAISRDLHQMVQVVERVWGICSMIHAMCYCQGIEELLAIGVPPRAKMLRIIRSELHRIQSHLLWLGLFADSFGFESLFMQFWKIREKVLDINEATTGNRVIISVNVVGGVRRDLNSEQMKWIFSNLSWIEEEMTRLESTLLSDYTVKKRTVGKGVLSREKAFERLDFEPVVETEGDCYARSRVRFHEVFRSIDLVRQAASKIPEGEIRTEVKGRPEGETISRTEQPRGNCFIISRPTALKISSG